jgi:proline iminopeptidase
VRPNHIRAQALKTPGLRVVRRPPTAKNPQFDLAYTRTGPSSGRPVVILPGGPGLASVLPYRGLRKRATGLGIDTIMIEHRGIGLSRADTNGHDLPPSAITITAVIDDIAAVLDNENVSAAVIYGSSYGTYLASGFGISYPTLVAGMVLDSTVMSAHDHHIVRLHARELLWNGNDPALAPSAHILRELVASGAVGQDEACDAVRKVYEFGGPRLLTRFLDQVRDRRAPRTWKFVTNLGRSETGDEIAMPYSMEFGAVGAIAFTELNYAPTPDGAPFDPAPQFVETASKYAPFAGEPFDLARELPEFAWPTAIISGSRDLRTPRPIAERATELIPHAQLIDLDNGHSALDTHQLAALHVIERITTNQAEKLTTTSDRELLDAFPIRGSAIRFLPHLISFFLRWDRLIDYLRCNASRFRSPQRWRRVP